MYKQYYELGILLLAIVLAIASMWILIHLTAYAIANCGAIDVTNITQAGYDGPF